MIKSTTLLCLALGVAVVPACDSAGKGSAKTTTADTSKKATKTTAKKKGGAKVVLESVKDKDMGYEIMIPKGAKVLQKDKLSGHTYSLPIGSGQELNIHITGVANNTLASLKKNATMMGTKDVEEEKKLANGGFIVVKKPQFSVQEVWVAKKGKGASLTAKCTGPKAQKAKLKEMCSSLKVTK